MYATVLDKRNILNISTFRNALKFVSSSGGVKWFDCGGNIDSAINYKLNTIEKYVELTYSVNGHLYCYKVKLETLPSNLGIGIVWFFICPKTHKRCRKLHFINGLFLHRTAFKNAYYKIQTYSKEYRNSFFMRFRNQFKIAEIMEAINAPYYKPYYRNKVSKRTLAYINKLEKLSGKDLSELKY